MCVLASPLAPGDRLSRRVTGLLVYTLLIYKIGLMISHGIIVCEPLLHELIYLRHFGVLR